MISIRPSQSSELAVFHAMERQPHVGNFIISTSLETHQKNFANPSILYLSIESDAGELVGYFILALEENRRSVEFRRIVIDQARRGVGQEAIRQMERYCKTRLSAKRIWLDVFEDNDVGRHIYKKLGFTHFKTEIFEARKLLFFEKTV